MPYLYYRVRGELRREPLENINYLRSSGRKIIVDTVDGVIEFYDYMKNIIPQLDNRFCQCHGSLAINMTMIDHFEKNIVKFKNDHAVHIGNHNFSQTKKKYRDYLEVVVHDILN